MDYKQKDLQKITFIFLGCFRKYILIVRREGHSLTFSTLLLFFKISPKSVCCFVSIIGLKISNEQIREPRRK